MGDQRRCESAPVRGEKMSSSAAAGEAFGWLNAATRKEYRGWGDTQTAARDRAASKAGVTPAQAERIWKNWRSMKTVNGDVYRLLRNKYEHLCKRVEETAEHLESERREIEETNAIGQSARTAMASVAKPAEGAAETGKVR